MKLTIKLLTILSVMYFTGCKELQVIKFDKSSSTAEFTIDQGTNGAVNKTPAINVDLEQIAKDNGTNLDKIKGLKLKSAKVTSTNGKSYDEFASITISIVADGLSMKQIIVKNPVNAGGASSVDLDVDQTLDLLPYFKGTNKMIQFEGSTSTAVAEDIVSQVDMTYEIEAEIL
ncbi:hypothetical protein OAB01_03875 [Bacteroidia bacterium]|nr:hypothetical protein [Bacteroidia bacterium]